MGGTRNDDGPALGSGWSSSASRRPFIDRLIVPQASAVWSADPRQMWTFPARFLVEFFDNHGMLSFRGRPRWRTISGGSARYVDALLRRFTGRAAPAHAGAERPARSRRRAGHPARRRARAV